MTTSNAVHTHYKALADDPDPLVRAVAQRQLARLGRLTHSGRDAAATSAPSRWRHVPLVELFEQAGNTVVARSGGRFESGHEPLHRSKSGRCVLIDPSPGRWWCRSCRQGGDAIALVVALRSWTYGRAACWLTSRYGPPASSSPSAQRQAPRGVRSPLTAVRGKGVVRVG